ncbi:hypothetical protein D3C87_299200 [compost metagenome]
MKHYLLILILVCAGLFSRAQTNLVKNPSFEEYSKCPDDINQMVYAEFWNSVVDTVGVPSYAAEYFNSCAGTNIYSSLPANIHFYQNPKSGIGMAGATFYYDKTPPYPGGVPKNWRDYIQGHLRTRLISGKEYCVSFWLNVAEVAGYAHNKIGIYFDDGTINHSIDTPGKEILSVIPQIFTDSIITDTANWIKVEKSFIATGNETHLTMGNFFKNSEVDTTVLEYRAWLQYSYYLIDDVSVIESDLRADAGPDNFVEETKTVQIGRVDDTTTAGLECKWFHKGAVIDSGAIITVHAGSKGDIDTFIVVQTICGAVKMDTTVIYTVGLGTIDIATTKPFTLYPNPSKGTFNISGAETSMPLTAQVYDLMGRQLLQQLITNNNTKWESKLPAGIYILELRDGQGRFQRERLQVQ